MKDFETSHVSPSQLLSLFAEFLEPLLVCEAPVVLVWKLTDLSRELKSHMALKATRRARRRLGFLFGNRLRRGVAQPLLHPGRDTDDRLLLF